jgi:hypothetical protein
MFVASCITVCSLNYCHEREVYFQLYFQFCHQKAVFCSGFDIIVYSDYCTAYVLIRVALCDELWLDEGVVLGTSESW